MFIAKHIQYVNLLNVISLAGMSYWQIDEANHYPMLILSLLFGIILLPMNNSLGDNNKQIIKVATIITFFAFLSLIKPFFNVIQIGDNIDIFRISTMMITSTISLIGLIYCVNKTKNNLI